MEVDIHLLRDRLMDIQSNLTAGDINLAQQELSDLIDETDLTVSRYKEQDA